MPIFRKKNVIKFKPFINLSEMVKFAAEMIATEVNAHHRANICLSGATSLDHIYSELAKNQQWQKTNLQHNHLFISYEYMNVFKNYLKCDNTHFTHRFFVEQKKMNPNQIHIPSSSNYKKFDSEIKKTGGLDLIVLTVGLNGRIAFNEPGTSINSNTHVTEISNEERNALISYFDEKINVPTQTVTIGIRTILKAKKIILIAYGKSRALAVAKLFEGKYSKKWPITSLVYHKDLTVLCDLEASNLIF